MMKKSFVLLILTLLAVVGTLYLGKYLAPRFEQEISTDVHTALSRSNIASKEDTLVHVSIDGRNVTLEGYAPSTRSKEDIKNIVRSVPFIGDVHNNLAIQSSVRPQKQVTEQVQEQPKPAYVSVLKKTPTLDKIVCDPQHCEDELNISTEKKKEQK